MLHPLTPSPTHPLTLTCSDMTELLSWLLLIVALLALLAGGLLLWWMRRAQARTGLPAGQVVYSDTGVERAVPEPLVSHRLGLIGKPDYLIEVQGGGRRFLAPVEVKSRRAPAQPPLGHVLQLAAYCLLVEEVHRQRPPHGVLRYADASLTIAYTDDLRSQVLHALDAIRQGRRQRDMPRSHEEPWRCRSCGYRSACGEEAL
jgi:CRISPR-associated exonuclease Cas4